jgi:hypothetical protein
MRGWLAHHRPTTKWQVLRLDAVPCRAVPCRAVPCRAVPCRAVPCRTVPLLRYGSMPMSLKGMGSKTKPGVV